MMEKEPKKITVGYLNADGKQFSAQLSQFEKSVKMLFEIDFVTLKATEDIVENPDSLDLIIVSALSLPHDKLSQWLKKFFDKMEKQAGVYVPCLIASDVPYKDLADLYHDAYEDNWYFDIIGSQQWDSLPIRIANLLRIHDHIHEMMRYRKTLDGLAEQVHNLENELNKLKKAN